jgi:hypothetical protein
MLEDGERGGCQGVWDEAEAKSVEYTSVGGELARAP